MKRILLCIVLLTATASTYAGIINIGSGSTSPNDCTIGCMTIYQQAYDSSYFGGSPITLNTLSIFGGSGYSGTYDVSIGYMNGNYSSITTNFASNFSSSPVITDSINLATDIVGGVLTIDLGFNYNASLGDLLVQFIRTSASSFGNFAASSSYAWSRAYEWPHGSTSAHSGYALNSVFDYSVSQVPEPGSLALLGLSLAGFGFSRKFKNS